MKSFLGLLLVVAISVRLCNGACYVMPNAAGESRGCEDSDGMMHEFNSNWKTENCLSCSCSRAGINCCSLVSTPFGYDEVKCKEVFHKESCTITVVEKDNPTKTCQIKGAVG
ncbi:beta-microseminoprotein-like [Tachyglossus aculeatus]|uniref:beta-microseminoprotein-like n=1 Tax=Tachyglossus aculeatus TaxID=9261 RepID=UPI0018F6E975|nr:beta-microseminoprotein-like [Tachyglossus aculeatus]